MFYIHRKEEKMGINVGYLKSDTTSKGDECYTPYYAIEPLLEYIPKDKIIWCPFDEEWSAFYQTFKKHGYHVIRSHIKEGFDFFNYEPNEWDIMVSNPPFSKKVNVLDRALKLGKPFALLLPLGTIQGQHTFPIMKQGIEVLAFDKRVAFHTKGDMEHYTKGTAFATAYFCNNILPEKLILKKLDEYEKPLKTYIQ